MSLNRPKLAKDYIIIKEQEPLNKAIQLTIIEKIKNLNEHSLAEIYDLLSVYVESNGYSYEKIALEIERLRELYGEYRAGFYERRKRL